MSFLSQSNRAAVLTTPLGSDNLEVQSVEGVDEISQLFSYDLTLLADATNDINFSSILGKSISLSFDDGSGTLRYISGISTQFFRLNRLELARASRPCAATECACSQNSGPWGSPQIV